jgi:probable rRNA maturation factor
MRDGLVVAVSDGRGRRVPDGGLGRWLATVAPARARGEVAVALVTDGHVRTLNRLYRRKDAATDVLSFPGSTDGAPRTSSRHSQDEDERAELGDIVIAKGVARRQAREAGHAYQTELRVLALHGLLHLLGFDHHDAKDNGRMAKMETRLLRKGGLAAGLIERSRP